MSFLAVSAAWAIWTAGATGLRACGVLRIFGTAGRDACCYATRRQKENENENENEEDRA
jgi:hypothetical protein